jgi:hypothetical protein
MVILAFFTMEANLAKVKAAQERLKPLVFLTVMTEFLRTKDK